MKNGENSYEESDLYGYRYDPEFKRYFKIGGEPCIQESHNRRSRCPSPSFNSHKKSKNLMKHAIMTGYTSVSGIPQALQLRESGFTENPKFSRDLVEMKLRNFKPSYNQKVSLNLEVVSCDYIQGHKDYVVGAWQVHDGFQHLLVKGEFVDFEQMGNEINLDSYFSDENSVIAKLHQRQILCDMCIGDLNSDSLCIAYVSNSVDPGVTSSSAACFSVSRTVGSDDGTLICRFGYQDASESCAFSSIKKQLAFGLETGIRIYSLDSAYRKRVRLPGRPFSMNFSSDDNLLCCGLHNGTLVGMDLRVPSLSPPALHFKLARGLFNLKILDNQTTLIASAFDHKLLNVDLRSKQVVFQYPYHTNLYKRLLPLSYDEHWNVLCSPGQDNVTRLWSLKEGKLLLSVPAPSGDLRHNLHKSWLHPTARGPLLHLWQGDSAYLYET